MKTPVWLNLYQSFYMLTKKTAISIQDTIFHFSLLFLSSVSNELRAVTCGHSCLNFTPTALRNNSFLLFYFLFFKSLLSLQSYLSGCPSGLPNDGGVGLTQQRLSKVRLLLQHLARLIHPTAAERKRWRRSEAGSFYRGDKSQTDWGGRSRKTFRIQEEIQERDKKTVDKDSIGKIND